MTERLPDHARSAADDAIRIWQQGDPDAALKVLLPLLESYPEDIGLKSIIGFIYYRADRLLEAYPYIKEVADLQPNRKLIALALFCIFEGLGMDAEAIAQAGRLAALTGLDDDEELSLHVAARGVRPVH